MNHTISNSAKLKIYVDENCGLCRTLKNILLHTLPDHSSDEIEFMQATSKDYLDQITVEHPTQGLLVGKDAIEAVIMMYPFLERHRWALEREAAQKALSVFHDFLSNARKVSKKICGGCRG